ncbi:MULTISPECIES: hypothetical protein [unclassified Flavobacterium]|uniref:hypothetical protein n=1 Tax=unclassified Flavobacterium TaxID=196869 RepID=UPI001E5D8CFD|nr:MULTISPECIES: hypothetical protein [unclassified Flavobacterium]
MVQGVVVDISYNIQAAVDDKHNLVVATHTINRNDKNALSAIALYFSPLIVRSDILTLLRKRIIGQNNVKTS